MPTPAKTSRAELLRIALTLVDEHGANALTLSAVAQEAGVKPPSLYKHFADRAALLKEVEIEVLHLLEGAIRSGTKGRTPNQRLHAMALTYRNFAIEKPHRYACIYSENAFADPEIAAASYFSAKPLFEELERAGVPQDEILPVSRTLTAFLHGFVSMEIVNAFRLGGDINEAFEKGLATLLKAAELG